MRAKIFNVILIPIVGGCVGFVIAGLVLASCEVSRHFFYGMTLDAELKPALVIWIVSVAAFIGVPAGAFYLMIIYSTILSGFHRRILVGFSLQAASIILSFGIIGSLGQEMIAFIASIVGAGLSFLLLRERAYKLRHEAAT